MVPELDCAVKTVLFELEAHTDWTSTYTLRSNFLPVKKKKGKSFLAQILYIS